MASQAASAITAFLTGKTPNQDLLSTSVEPAVASAALERRVLAHLGTNGPATRSALCRALDTTGADIDAALAALKDDGLITGGTGTKPAKLQGH
jgi:predicted HTH transcriptional regulator